MARLGRPILISMWSNRLVPDALRLGIWPRTAFVLQPSGKGRGIPFVRAAVDAQLWPADAEVRIGHSVLTNLHPIPLKAVAEICARRIHRPLRQAAGVDGGEGAEAAGHLADWLLACVSEGLLTESQISYLFASGGRRARAISTMLRTVGKTSLPHIVDVGTGVGLIPWLLCAEGDRPRSVDLFEPRKSGRTALQRLWNHGRVGEYTVAYLGGDNVPFSRPADLIMFCHCLFHIDQRQAVLRRAWQALKPGGVLLVNETPKEAGGADRLRDALLTRTEIVAGMPGTPRLFSARTGWRTAHEPHAGSARAIGSSGLFVSVKD